MTHPKRCISLQVQRQLDLPSSDADIATVDSFAEVKFYATGLHQHQHLSSLPHLLCSANEGVQTIDSNTENTARPNLMAQTFNVENFEGGMFTKVLIYSSMKSTTIPLKFT